MSGIKYLLDTNIIIGMYERNPAVINLLKSKQATINECAYSSITRMELLGFPEISANEIKTLSSLLNQMPHLNINRAIEDKTINLKQQHRIKPYPKAVFTQNFTHKIFQA